MLVLIVLGEGRRVETTLIVCSMYCQAVAGSSTSQLLTLFLPAKKVTLKTRHGQNQPMCK